MDSINPDYERVDNPWVLRRDVEVGIELLTIAPGIRAETFSRFPEMRERAIYMMQNCSRRIADQKEFLSTATDPDEVRELETTLAHLRSINNHLIETMGMIPEPHEL